MGGGPAIHNNSPSRKFSVYKWELYAQMIMKSYVLLTLLLHSFIQIQ